MKYFNGPAGRPDRTEFTKYSRRELNQLANEFIENAIEQYSVDSNKEFIALTRNESTRLAWLESVGRRGRDVNRFTQWSDHAYAVDCAGLAWALRRARNGKRIYVASDEDGYYFASN